MVSPERGRMKVVPPEVEASSVAEACPAGRRNAAGSLVLACYLLVAVILTLRLWIDPARRVQVGDPHDVDLFAWYIRYAATAVSHGRLPALVTTSLNQPQGVSLMWNTSLLVPGVLLAPVTLLAGPQVTLTTVLTLGLAGSAASMYWVLRRWGASIGAAALGGAVYGFSPALINSGIGHYHLVLAVALPLMIDALLRIVTGRGRWAWAGAWLGLLASAQVFISEEMLVNTALAGLVLVVVLAASRPRAVAARLPSAALGLATAAAVFLVLCGHALLLQIQGPLHQHSVLLGEWSSDTSFFVDPAGTELLHTPAGAAAVAGFHLGPSEALAYLGWPLLAVVVVAAVWYWRDLRVRVAAVVFLVLELCSLGGGSQPIVPGWLLPWHWLQGLPAMAQVLPDRFAIPADGAAAAVLVFALDRTLDRALDRARSGEPGTRAWRPAVPVAVAVLAVVPLIPLPYQTAPLTPVPAGWQAAFARLHLAPHARVLVVPIANVGHTQAMRWQADTGQPAGMIGGYFLGPSRTGQATFDPGPARYADKYVDWLWDGKKHASASIVAAIRPAVARWRPAAVIADTSPGSGLGRVLIQLFGPPTFRTGAVLVWKR
jgi:hypothetical protein